MFKKLLVVLVAVALTAGYAQAQEAKSSSKVRLGIHLGVGGNGVYGIDAKYEASGYYNEASPRFGMQLGMVAEYSLTNNLALHSGFIFDGQGFKDELMKCRLHYVRIPINAQYSLPVGKHSLVFKAGPYMGIAYAGNYKGRAALDLGGLLPSGSSFNRPIADEVEFHFGNKENYVEGTQGEGGTTIEHSYFSRIDMGVDFGAGFRFNNRFQLGWEYSLGFTPINKTYGYKNRSFNFTFTWMLGR